MENKNISAIIYAVSAVLFYAVNVPCSKVLLNHVSPAVMAGLLYIGAGLGVGIMYVFHFKNESPQERLEKKDMPYTVGMVLLDIIAPILLMMGIKFGTSSNASLLNNFEIVATALIALFVFGEKITKRLWNAILLITVSSIILSFSGSDSLKFSLGSVLVIGAAVCWGMENNCTRNISEKSTHQIVTIKGFGSGTGSLVFAFLKGERLPEMKYIFIVILLGYVAYGLSIFTYIKAQKTLGAARTSAYYAFAPFIGTFLSFAVLHEKLSYSYLVALIIMIAGTVIVVADTLVRSHSHEHTHTFTHTHDGSTHTHTITHTHEHEHIFTDSKHGHVHSLEELELSLHGH